MTSCLYCLKCNCFDYNSRTKLQRPTLVLKILQITVFILYVATTESCLIYLSSINVAWRRGFSSFDFNRVVAWLSLATTTALTLMLAQSQEKTQWLSKSSGVCYKCDGGGKIYEKSYSQTKFSWCNIVYLDFFHSMVVAILALSCAFWMVVDIPQEYEHHVEVALKLVGFIFDIFLSLLFTKSCIAAYTSLEESPEECVCEDTILWERQGIKSPLADDKFSNDDDSLTALLTSNDENEQRSYANPMFPS